MSQLPIINTIELSGVDYELVDEQAREDIEPIESDIDSLKEGYVRPEAYGAKGDGTTDDTAAIKSAIAAGNTIYFSNTSYKVNGPIFLYGKKNLIGNGATILLTGADSISSPAFVPIICGTSSVGGSANNWTGSIDGFNFVCSSGVFDQVIGLFSVNKCAVRNCTFDASASGVNITNKVIGSVINANFVTPQGRQNIVIEHNKITMHDLWSEDRNNCECVGMQQVTNAIVRDNVFNNIRDDLGFHGCTNILVENNVLNSFDGRIFASNTKRLTIRGNRINYISASTSGMGICLFREGVDRTVSSEDVWIEDNYVDYTEAYNVDANDNASYGIRIGYVINCTVSGNTLIGYTASGSEELGHHHARIYVERERLNSTSTYYYPENIRIFNNKVKSIYTSGLSDTHNFFCYDNIIEDSITIPINAVARNNIVTSATGTYSGPPTKYIKLYSSNISTSYSDMTTHGGLKKIYIPHRIKVIADTTCSYATINSERDTGNTGWYSVNIYKNGNAVADKQGTATIVATGHVDSINAALGSSTFAAGDYAMAKIRAEGSISPISDAIEVCLGVAEY